MEKEKAKSVMIVDPADGSPCWLNVDRVIALVRSKNLIIFESATWTLRPEDFNKVWDLWFKLNPSYIDKPK